MTQQLDEDGLCVRSGLLPEQCAHCRGVDDIELPPLPSAPVGRLFLASYPGRCGDCGEHIDPGDMIARSSGGYVCEECFALA